MVLTGAQDEHDGGVDGEDVCAWNGPAGGCPAGSVVFGCRCGVQSAV